MIRYLFLFFSLVLGVPPTTGQPDLRVVLFSDLSPSELKKTDAAWVQFDQKNTLTEDQFLAWFDIRFHLYSQPGLPFSEDQKAGLLELVSRCSSKYPRSFAAQYMGIRFERNQESVAKLPNPESAFQQELANLERAKAELMGYSVSGNSVSTVLGKMTAEHKSYYANMLKSIHDGDLVMVGGFEDALGLYATNMSAGVGKSCEIICLDALLNNTYRTKLGTKHMGHPAATGSPKEFVSRLLSKAPNHAVISVSSTFDLYATELDKLHIRGLVLTPIFSNNANVKLWKSFDKSHISKGKKLAVNYLPMLNAAISEPEGESGDLSKSIKDLIKSLQ